VPSVSIHEADIAREAGWGPFDPYAPTPLALHHRLIVDGRLYSLCTYFRGVQLDPSEPYEVSLEARVVVRPVEAPPPPPGVAAEPTASSSSGQVPVPAAARCKAYHRRIAAEAEADSEHVSPSSVRPFASHSFDPLLPVRPSSAVGGEAVGGEAWEGEVVGKHKEKAASRRRRRAGKEKAASSSTLPPAPPAPAPGAPAPGTTRRNRGGKSKNSRRRGKRLAAAQGP